MNYFEPLNVITIHWTIILWAIALLLSISIFTRIWKYTIYLTLIFTFISWLLAAYAGWTGEWYIGWFGYTPLISTALAMRIIYLRLMDES